MALAGQCSATHTCLSISGAPRAPCYLHGCTVMPEAAEGSRCKGVQRECQGGSTSDANTPHLPRCQTLQAGMEQSDLAQTHNWKTTGIPHSVKVHFMLFCFYKRPVLVFVFLTERNLKRIFDLVK